MASADVLLVANGVKESKRAHRVITNDRVVNVAIPGIVVGHKPGRMNVYASNSNRDLGLDPRSTYQGVYARQAQNIYNASASKEFKRNTPPYRRLPNLLGQRPSSRKFARQSSHWRASLPSSAVHTTSSSDIIENMLPMRPHTSAGKITAYGLGTRDWTPTNGEITAKGQGLLSQTYRSRSYYNPSLKGEDTMRFGTHLPHHTVVNYIPFYEPRTRGDGSSDISHAQKKAKSVQQTKFTKSNERNDPIEAVEIRPESTRQSSKAGTPEWPGASEKSQRMEKKRVRFSTTISDKMEEPAYVETLSNSLTKALPNGIKEGWTISTENIRKNFSQTRKISTPNEAVSTVADEEDQNNFVSPITRVTVTRRKISDNSNRDENALKAEATIDDSKDTKLTPDPAGQNVHSMASKIINSTANNSALCHNEQGEKKPHGNIIPTKSNLSRPKGFLTARAFRKGEIVPISRYVQKKQAIITASFPDRSKTERRTFMSYATKIIRSENSGKSKQASENDEAKQPLNNTGKGKALTSYKQTAPLSGHTSRQQVQCVSIDLNINNLSPSNLQFETPRSSTSLLSAYATHFQPIPSMPDHINFCDPRKTEHILEWLDDVNKKRNIEKKIARVSSSMSTRTVS